MQLCHKPSRLLIVLCTAGLSLGALPAHAAADAIRLHSQARVTGQTVMLHDVAALQGDRATAFGDTVVVKLSKGGQSKKVTLAVVRKALTKAGANWGLLTLGGYAACRVHWMKKTKTTDGHTVTVAASPDTTSTHTTTHAASAADAAANPKRAVDLDSSLTVRGLVLDKLVKFVGGPKDKLHVTFRKRDRKVLATPTIGKRFEVVPRGSATLGRIPVAVRRYDGAGDRATTTHVVMADVARQCEALVATRTINRDATFTKASFKKTSVMLDDDRGTPLRDPKKLDGQVAAGLLHKGTVIYADDVESPLLVRRNELVTVRCVSGGLVVRTVARARSDGRLHDRITVGNQSTHKRYTVTVTGPREVTVGAPHATPPDPSS